MKTGLTLSILAVFSLLVLVFLMFRAPERHQPDILLRTYNLEHANPEEVRDILNRAFKDFVSDANRIAHVETLPGKLVVMAPENVQKGVAALVADLNAGTSDSSTDLPANASIDCWIVLGKPGKPKTQPQELNEITDVIQEISAVQGEQNFMLLEKLSSTVSLGHQTDISGAYFAFSVGLERVQDRMIGRITLMSRGINHLSFDSRVILEPGKSYVVGESQLGEAPDIDRIQSFAGDDSCCLWYVIRCRS